MDHTGHWKDWGEDCALVPMQELVGLNQCPLILAQDCSHASSLREEHKEITMSQWKLCLD